MTWPYDYNRINEKQKIDACSKAYINASLQVPPTLKTVVGGINIYIGAPSEETGCNVNASSYFDRLWKKDGHFFL